MAYFNDAFDVDEAYFLWLCGWVGAADPDNGYLGLLRTMYDTEFTDRTAKLIPNDQNRVCDAIKLRDRFMQEEPEAKNFDGVFSNPCSCLEILVALAIRITEEFCYNDESHWFWEMMDNLGLSEFTDERYFTPIGQDKVYHILRDWRMRKYDRDGNGSPFPVHFAERDQRKTEIWYQMNAYLIERYM